MQIRKTYKGLNPQVLYDDLKDFVLKQGTVLSTNKLETYSMPEDSSTFIYRGTMTFKNAQSTKECAQVHILGSDKSEIKLMMDVDETCLPKDKVTALQDDLDFVFGSYEQKPKS